MATRKEQIVVEAQPTDPRLLIVWCDDHVVPAIQAIKGVSGMVKRLGPSGGYLIYVDHRYSVAEVADEIRALASTETTE